MLRSEGAERAEPLATGPVAKAMPHRSVAFAGIFELR
jgi:hypothetical protein